jgi:U-box domain
MAEGNLDEDEENANMPLTVRSNDAKQCTIREPDMVNATAAATMNGTYCWDDQLNEELPPASAEVDNVVTGVRRSEAGCMPHVLLQDPLTNTRMVDPVVIPAGDSYERSSLLWTDESIEFYPNRALQSILKQQDDYEKHQPTAIANDLSKESLAFVCAIRWWYHDPTKHPSPPLPEAFYCPITCDIMVDPWIGPDGSTYEYDGIKAWLAQPDREAISPVTRQALSLGQLRPNHALYELIQWETQRPPSERHAAVQKWMDSTPNTKRLPCCDHPLPRSVTSWLPNTFASLQPPSQNTAGRQSPPTPVSGGTTTSTVSVETSNMRCVIVGLWIGVLLVVWWSLYYTYMDDS